MAGSSVYLTEIGDTDTVMSTVLDRKEKTDNPVEECPLFGLGSEFPDEVYLLREGAGVRYACFCDKGVHGLAAFSTENAAIRFTEWIADARLVTYSCPFDEAREIAKERPAPLRCVYLMDDVDNPKTHWIN